MLFTRTAAHVVIEVGSALALGQCPCSRNWGIGVTVANPRRLKLISESDNKTAGTTRTIGAAGTFRRHATGCGEASELAQAQADLAVTKARDVLVATRTKLVNHVRGSVQGFRRAVAEVLGSELRAPESNIVRRRAQAGARADLPDAREARRANQGAGQADRARSQAVPGRRRGFATVGSRSADRAGICADDRGQESVSPRAGWPERFWDYDHARASLAMEILSFGSPRRAIRSCGSCWSTGRTTVCRTVGKDSDLRRWATGDRQARRQEREECKRRSRSPENSPC